MTCEMCNGTGLIAVTDGVESGFQACPKCSANCDHHQSRTIYREVDGDYVMAGFWCQGCDKIFAIEV
jgi:hypothetical protein